jgi:hypothetical protein
MGKRFLMITEGTPQLIRAIGNRDEEEAKDMMKKTIPLGRLGKPEDICLRCGLSGL